MLKATRPFKCLTFCRLPYTGVGWPQSCVSVLGGFSATPVAPVLVLPRARARPPGNVKVISALPPILSALPWRMVADLGRERLDSRFANLIDRADPGTTIAYFWPGVPHDLVLRAKARGILTVREMINTTLATAKPILDAAYADLGLPQSHSIMAAAIQDEVDELALYDLVCASNAPCESSLIAAGVRPEQIVSTSFGWTPERYAIDTNSLNADRVPGKPKFLFAGSISVRKGIPTLIKAWKKAGIDGELTLVGNVEPVLAPLVARAVANGAVRLLPFTPDIGALYRSHDVFVFPTLEEGGPQVTIEAGGCGLPSITTPMGAARLVRNGENGIIVPPGDVDALSAAIVALASDPDRRIKYARQIANDAHAFTYDRLGAERALAFADRLERSPSTVRSVRA